MRARVAVVSAVPADRRSSTRLPTLDVLRGVAIVSMLIAHGVPFLWPTGVSRPLEVALGAVNAVASPLFGLAMGAAAALVWARPSVRRDWPRRVLTDIARGVVVFALGMILVELATWVAIVLHVLGVLMVIGLPVAALAGRSMRAAPPVPALRWVLAGLTLSLFVLAPWVTGAVAPGDERLPNGTTGGVAEIWAAFIAGYSYRAVSLLPFFALGALLASVGVLDRVGRLAFGSAVSTALLLPAYWLVRRSADIALSGDPVDQLFDLALVSLALALVALVVVVSPRPLWQPVADLGAVALSVYALQLVVLRPLMDWEAWQDSAGWAWVSLITLVLLPSVLMVGWRRRLGPGPLEHVVALVTGKRVAT